MMTDYKKKNTTIKNEMHTCAQTACKGSCCIAFMLHNQPNMEFGPLSLVFGFHRRFELCVKIAKILEERTNRAEQRNDTSIKALEENMQGPRLFAWKSCKSRLCLDDIKGYMGKPEWRSKRSPNKLQYSHQERDQRLQVSL